MLRQRLIPSPGFFLKQELFIQFLGTMLQNPKKGEGRGGERGEGRGGERGEGRGGEERKEEERRKEKRRESKREIGIIVKKSSSLSVLLLFK